MDSPSLSPGQEIQGPPKEITLERMRGFSGWPNRNIHTDEEFAKACGLEAPVASATMYLGYLADLFLDSFGERWIEGGRLDVVFLKTVAPGDLLTAKARVKKAGPGGAASLEVWCENQRGEQAVVGTAGAGAVRS